MRELLWLVSPLIFFGVPGLAAAVALARWLKSWWGAIALILIGVVVYVGGLSRVPDDPDDDDPGLAIAIAASANLLAWIVGLVVTTAIVRRRPRRATP